MIILGLTGSIAMGKTETASMFRKLDVPVFDVDAVVHKAQAKNGVALAAIGELFEDVVVDGVLDRAKLGAIVFADRPKLADLVNIMTPIIRQARTAFFEKAILNGDKLIVLDEPLLFENGGDIHCDATLVVTAPEHIQRERALARAVMTPEKLDQILAQQMPDEEKRKKADYIVETDKGLEHAFKAVKKIIKKVSKIEPIAYKEYWENARNSF